MNLEPCPFCKSDNIIVGSERRGQSVEMYAWCPGCGARGPSILQLEPNTPRADLSTAELAAKAWNGRK